MVNNAIAYNRLNLTSERIEQVLRDRGAPASVVGGRVLPAFVELLLRPEGGTRVSQVKALQPDIALAVGNGNIRIAQSGSHLAIQIGRDMRQVVSLPTLLAQVPDLKPYTAILGMSEEGSPLMARITSPEVVHMLIAGTTGCGKTELSHTIMRLLIAAHRPAQLSMVMIDPKAMAENAEFARMCQRHLLMPPARSSADAMAVLTQVVAALDARIDNGNTQPVIVVLIDELADLCQNAPGAVDMLTRIGQVGRQAGIHLIACTQKPTSGAIGSLLKGNLPLRLVGRVTSGEEARVASGIAGSGAERLMGGGDFIAVGAGGRVIRFQAALPCMDQGLDVRPFSAEAMPIPVTVQWRVKMPESEPQAEPVAPVAQITAPVMVVTPTAMTGDGFDQWVSECLMPDPETRTKAAELFAGYRAWTIARGTVEPLTLTAFGLRMTQYGKDVKAAGVTYGVRWVWTL